MHKHVLRSCYKKPELSSHGSSELLLQKVVAWKTAYYVCATKSRLSSHGKYVCTTKTFQPRQLRASAAYYVCTTKESNFQPRQLRASAVYYVRTTKVDFLQRTLGAAAALKSTFVVLVRT